MQPDASDERFFPVSQSELREYRELEDRLKREAAIFAGWRQSIIGRLNGPASIEPGPIAAAVAYAETGRTIHTEEGPRPLTTRRLILLETQNLTAP